MTEIPIICVARNSLALTKLAVKSALAQDMPVRVLLVDNASTDGTGEWARTKEIALIAFTEQKSLAECWNTALQTAWLAGYEKALVINNDVELRPDCARMLDMVEELFVTGVGVDGDHLGPRDLFGLLESEAPHPDFSCFLISREVTNKIGWFDVECFPAYCEDSDFHVRMHRAGIRAISVDLPFLHHRSGTLRNSEPFERKLIERGAQKNRERFRAKYGCLPGSKEYEELFK